MKVILGFILLMIVFVLSIAWTVIFLTIFGYEAVDPDEHDGAWFIKWR